ncbi:MAG: Asp-tRNA(Asn)/Glu-tRNA(Gln) amidotransferase subunit GatC [Chloroflexi bacterium]|nr:Asp-tRNA(Asn)/Glu-tRNA(Gln) amidotransferase subunit GatC [Chloroflexota bacterium]
MPDRTPQLTIEEVRHIAILCRVGATDEELERLREQLTHILEQFQVLQEIDTEGVPPTGHSVALHSVMRDDEPGPSYPAEEVLANAPRQEDDYFRVRAVLE